MTQSRPTNKRALIAAALVAHDLVERSVDGETTFLVPSSLYNSLSADGEFLHRLDIEKLLQAAGIDEQGVNPRYQFTPEEMEISSPSGEPLGNRAPSADREDVILTGGHALLLKARIAEAAERLLPPERERILEEVSRIRSGDTTRKEALAQLNNELVIGIARPRQSAAGRIGHQRMGTNDTRGL